MVISPEKKTNKQKKTRHDTAETSLLNLHFLKTIITRLCAQWNLFGYHKQCQQLGRQYTKTELAAQTQRGNEYVLYVHFPKNYLQASSSVTKHTLPSSGKLRNQPPRISKLKLKKCSKRPHYDHHISPKFLVLCRNSCQLAVRFSLISMFLLLWIFN